MAPSYRLALSLNLADLFRDRGPALRALEARAEAARREARVRVAQAYFRWLSAREAARTAADGVEAREAELKALQARARVGAAAPHEVLAAAERLSQARLALYRANLDLALALEDLARAVGLPLEALRALLRPLEEGGLPGAPHPQGGLSVALGGSYGKSGSASDPGPGPRRVRAPAARWEGEVPLSVFQGPGLPLAPAQGGPRAPGGPGLPLPLGPAGLGPALDRGGGLPAWGSLGLVLEGARGESLAVATQPVEEGARPAPVSVRAESREPVCAFWAVFLSPDPWRMEDVGARVYQGSGRVCEGGRR